MSTPAKVLSSSPPTCCGVPMPGLAYDSFPGCALASAISSARLFAGTSLLTARMLDMTSRRAIGTKSRAGSKLGLLCSDGPIVSAPLALQNSVKPSGAAFATRSPATLPAAPGRFSTVTGTFHASLNFCANRRAVTSVALPGVNPTMMRTGLSG